MSSNLTCVKLFLPTVFFVLQCCIVQTSSAILLRPAFECPALFFLRRQDNIYYDEIRQSHEPKMPLNHRAFHHRRRIFLFPPLYFLHSFDFSFEPTPPKSSIPKSSIPKSSLPEHVLSFFKTSVDSSIQTKAYNVNS